MRHPIREFLPLLTPKVVSRFWSKVNKDGSIPSHRPDLGQCWEWTASLVHGYGQISIGGRSFNPARANRVAWVIANGEIPEGLGICHACDNRKCVRPSHLFPGTQQDNMKDFSGKGFMRPTSLLNINPHRGAAAMWAVPGMRERRSQEVKQQWAAAKAAGRNSI